MKRPRSGNDDDSVCDRQSENDDSEQPEQVEEASTTFPAKRRELPGHVVLDEFGLLLLLCGTIIHFCASSRIQTK
jgi:hypothetical protein